MSSLKTNIDNSKVKITFPSHSTTFSSIFVQGSPCFHCLFLSTASPHTNPQYLDKNVSVQLNGSRKVTGTLRGYDVFMNITIADALEHEPSGEKLAIGTIVVRGNSIVSVEVCQI